MARYLSASSKGGRECVIVVPDNNNNTLGVALGVADAQGSLVKGTAARVSATDPSAGMTLQLSLQPGAEYTLLAGLQTLRDLGCAGTRPQWETCTTTPQAAAASLVQAMAPTAGRAAAVSASDAFWSSFWAASAVDLTSGATPTAAVSKQSSETKGGCVSVWVRGCVGAWVWGCGGASLPWLRSPHVPRAHVL